jgi:hypothetical protein
MISTKTKQASKATEQPLTIKKPKIGHSDNQVRAFYNRCTWTPDSATGRQSPTSSKKKSTHDNDVEVFTSSEGERYVQLGQKKRVTVREFKGELQ